MTDTVEDAVLYRGTQGLFRKLFEEANIPQRFQKFGKGQKFVDNGSIPLRCSKFFY